MNCIFSNSDCNGELKYRMPLAAVENSAVICGYHWDLRKHDVRVAASKKCTCWEGYERVPGTKPCESGSCRKRKHSSTELETMFSPVQSPEEITKLIERIQYLQQRRKPVIDKTPGGAYSRLPKDGETPVEYWTDGGPPEKPTKEQLQMEKIKRSVDPQRLSPSEIRDNSRARISPLVGSLKETIAHDLPENGLHVHDEEDPSQFISADEDDVCSCGDFENHEYELSTLFPNFMQLEGKEQRAALESAISILKNHNPLCNTCSHPFSTHTGKIDTACTFGRKTQQPAALEKERKYQEWKKTVPRDRLLDELIEKAKEDE